MKSGIEKKKARWGWFFVLPAIIYFSIFSFFPIINAFRTSLYRWNLLSLNPPRFVWFENYIRLFQSEAFWNSVKATAIFTVGTFSSLLIGGLALSILIFSRKRFRTFFQMALYSPAVLSTVVAATIWLLILDPRGLGNSVLNAVLGTSGKDYQWFANPDMSRISTIIIYFWKYIGHFTILFIAGLSSIPYTIHEAAIIDGAGPWKKYWRITFPLLKPTVVLVCVLSLIQCMKSFSTQYLFVQSGAPRAPIDVLTLSIYDTAIRDHQIGRASAMSIILFLTLILFSWAQLRLSRSEEVSFQ
ncbi:MAG TPA: sugar ABC transporter permease [Thermotogota bacterium]|jgi:multiple sugar transport system permease protein|nr:sugar ABC transporter permease [Thermotogota bacterium]NLH19450.1 sugar ABC transporter permease [Thermotogaceae bacterium]OQC30634.1 MAG: Lactose transport system permease protein LacF [Thermotogota bacterium ADurb.Bin062]HNW45851.1 sugar ABC transporter permease [Thermotogota bacterium]HNY81502.1 sugar ABC transporter permease [Thermotogota bacterium]